MKRKQFIKNTSFAMGVLLVANRIGASIEKRKAIQCAPEAVTQLTGTITSVKDGFWSDFATWGGVMPNAGDTIAVNHAVIYDLPISTFAGVNINGSLTFAPDKSTELSTRKNIVCQGSLIMNPLTSEIIHKISFIEINENNFVGGGMDVLSTDIGLWVMGNGKLDLQGSAKTSWTNSVNSIAPNDTNLAVRETQGWQVNDELFIAPSESPTVGDRYITGFENKTINSIDGVNCTVSKFAFAHPTTALTWTAEVGNLTRNVRIEGTASGKSHVFIRSTQPQNIKYVQFRFLGPRKQQGGDAATELVLGRYGLHFHHCMDGSYGSTVDGCVIRDAGNHAYVPHVSNGVTFKNNISYNTKEAAFWWDEGEASHDIIYDTNLVANCTYVSRSMAVDTTDPSTPNAATHGMMLGIGDDCIARNNVVCGCNTGDPGNGAAYTWQANNEGVWNFENNLAHNNVNGVFIWQNSSLNHVLDGTQIYNCGSAIMHGAYGNQYTFRGGKIYASPVRVEASSVDSTRVRFENISFDGGGILDYCLSVISSPIPAAYPTFIRGCNFKGFKKAGILDNATNEKKHIDVIHCTAVGTLASMVSASASEVVRIQPPSGQAVRMTKSGNTNIANFAPSVWGIGSGLKAEYFSNSNLQGSPVVTRVDSVIAFQQWSTSLHHKLSMNSHSMRWTGKVQAQFTEAYTFSTSVSGGVRLWVNDQLILDKWQDASTAFNSSAISLQAGQYFNIRLEYFNSNSQSGILLYWKSASLPQEIIPQSQLSNDYSGGTTTPPVIPPVEPPVEPPTQPTVTLTLTATPNPTRSNWSIKATSSSGGTIRLSIANQSGSALGTADVESGTSISYGASLARGTYYLTASQGSVVKTLTVIRN